MGVKLVLLILLLKFGIDQNINEIVIMIKHQQL